MLEPHARSLMPSFVRDNRIAERSNTSESEITRNPCPHTKNTYKRSGFSVFDSAVGELCGIHAASRPSMLRAHNSIYWSRRVRDS